MPFWYLIEEVSDTETSLSWQRVMRSKTSTNWGWLGRGLLLDTTLIEVIYLPLPVRRHAEPILKEVIVSYHITEFLIAKNMALAGAASVLLLLLLLLIIIIIISHLMCHKNGFLDIPCQLTFLNMLLGFPFFFNLREKWPWKCFFLNA